VTDLIFKVRSADLFRMAGWLVSGILLYAASIYIGIEHPQSQVILQKLGNVTLFSFVGYWIARQSLGRIDEPYHASSDPGRVVARAIVIGSAILAGALGL